MEAQNTEKKKAKKWPDSSPDFTQQSYIKGKVIRTNSKAWELFDGDRAGIYTSWKKLNKELERNMISRYKEYPNIFEAITAFKKQGKHLKPQAELMLLF